MTVDCTLGYSCASDTNVHELVPIRASAEKSSDGNLYGSAADCQWLWSQALPARHSVAATGAHQRGLDAATPATGVPAPSRRAAGLADRHSSPRLPSPPPSTPSPTRDATRPPRPTHRHRPRPPPTDTPDAASTPGPTPDGVARKLQVPILMYHYISTPPAGADVYRRDLSVTPGAVRRAPATICTDAGYTRSRWTICSTP